MGTSFLVRDQKKALIPRSCAKTGPQITGNFGLGVTAPRVLVVDDGELDRVQAVLERMSLDWMRCAEPDRGVSLELPSDLILSSGPRAMNARARGGRAAALGLHLRSGLPAAARAPARPRGALPGVGRPGAARVRAVPAPAPAPRRRAALGAPDSPALSHAARRGTRAPRGAPARTIARELLGLGARSAHSRPADLAVVARRVHRNWTSRSRAPCCARSPERVDRPPR